MTTFAALLAGRLRTGPGRPLITFYDGATSERTELSVATYANWVAKTASLLVEECDLTRGDRLLVDLPAHWLAPVFLGAAWTVGLTVVFDAEDGAADAVVCGPDAVDRWSAEAAGRPVVASALLPLGVRFPGPLPAGVLDFGVEVWGQPDSFVPWDPPTGADLAVPSRTQEELVGAATAGSLPEGVGFTGGGRLLTETGPASPSGLASFVEPLARDGSLVLVVRADADRLAATYAAERATARQSARS